MNHTFARWWLDAEKMKSLPLASTLICSTKLDLDRFALFPEKCILFITCVSISHRIALTVGQQLVLYLALLSCSLCSVKLHVVLLFEQIKKKKKKKNFLKRLTIQLAHHCRSSVKFVGNIKVSFIRQEPKAS